MARISQWRRTVSDTVSWRQDQGLGATIYTVREVGPTGFLLKEEGESKPVKVFLGDPHTCTCSGFRKEKDLCIHLCWLLLKKFKIAREDPISWQIGLVEREINAILHGEANRRATRNRPETARQASSSAPKAPDGRPALEQREIEEEDTCPICMEELLGKREPVTYCKYSCANSIHIKCMKIWAEHQTSAGEKSIKCPFCREDFGPAEYLREEYKNSVVPGLCRQRVTEHSGTLCRACTQSPITGKCYRCTRCNEYHLCQKCFNTPTHTDHSFEFRAVPGQRWRPAQRVITNGMPIPTAVVDNLMNRDIGDGDYDLLLQLDSSEAAELSQIPESVIQGFPMEKVRIGSRYLAPGEQCCVCLRAYQCGDQLRRLPCRHKFHKDCIDNWLLHQHPTCPVDGQIVWSRLSGDQESTNQRAPQRRRRPAQQRNNNQRRDDVERESNTNTAGLEIPGVGIVRLAHTQSADMNNNRREERAHSISSIVSEPAVRNRAQRDNSGLHTDGASINLAQLLLTDAIESRQDSDMPPSGGMSDIDYISSQIANSLPPDRQRQAVSANAATRQQRISVPSRVRQQNNTVTLSDTETENERRRKRNMNLATQTRLMSGSMKELTSTPSITTAQPVGISSLYLGNNPQNDVLSVAPESLSNRGRQTMRQTSQRKHPNLSNGMDHRSLTIGNPLSADMGTSRQTAAAKRRTGNPNHKVNSRVKSNNPSAQNLSALELTGMRFS